jgi:D-alanyl-D-alanine carboxypeptidase/D-alanyl-D-alanine-endopeptidase (penicillin-binding protein 4)
MPRIMLCLVVATSLVIPTPGRAQQPESLASRIESLTNGPDYKEARWGILVVDAKTGSPVYSLHPDKLFTPASTTKLYSCAAALMAFGPDYHFETPVYARGEISKDGTLKGDLILVASGDLTFGGRTGKDGRVLFSNTDHTYANSGLGEAKLTDGNPLAALEDLAKDVAKAGIKRVDGEVLIDDRLFAKGRGSGSGPDQITPILVNDNVIDLTVTPGKQAGDPAAVKMTPATAVVQMDADVTTGEPGSGNTLTIQTVGPMQFSVRGRVAADAKPQVRIWPVDDPAVFARGLFIEALRREGVRVQAGLARPARADLPDPREYKGMPRVGEFESPPFADAITVTLKVSHNLYASTLPMLLAAKNGSKSIEAGMQLQGKYLRDLGVDTKTISFAGGAGGAQADAVTPAATVQLLRGMAKRPEWEVYKAALPTLGVDGTLAESVKPDSPARGKAFGKTGTLVWADLMNGRSLLRSKALAGVMTTAKGTELVYALFVNDVPLPPGVPTSREGKALGRLCEILYEHGP